MKQFKEKWQYFCENIPLERFLKYPESVNVFCTKYADGTEQLYISNENKLVNKPSKPSLQTESDEDRSLRRSIKCIRDLLRNNKGKALFVTITNGNQDTMDDKTFKSKLIKSFNNWVQRENIDYLLVPELHKSGRVHFHGVIWNYKDTWLIDSGKRDKKGRTIYNLKNLSKYGFTTATLIDDYDRTTNYITKYITKDNDMIFKKRYFHSKGLKYPDYYYYYVDDIDILLSGGYDDIFGTKHGYFLTYKNMLSNKVD